MKFKILITSIISIIVMIIILSIFFPCFFTDVMNLTIVASILTALIMIHYNEYSKTKVTHDLFIHYNKRYNEIADDLRNIQNNTDNLIICKNNKIIEYINLCAEEYFWYKKGLINKKIWNNWRNGIEEKLRCNLIKEVFFNEYEENNKKDSYYDFFKDKYIIKIIQK